MTEIYKSEVLTIKNKPKEFNLKILKNKVTLMMNTKNITTSFKWLTLWLISAFREIILLSKYLKICTLNDTVLKFYKLQDLTLNSEEHFVELSSPSGLIKSLTEKYNYPKISESGLKLKIRLNKLFRQKRISNTLKLLKILYLNT